MMTCIAIVAAFAALHWIYESILAPSFRLHLRFQLFALRDELRELKMGAGIDLRDKHYHYLQDSINGLISMLCRLDLSTLHAITRELGRNSHLRETIDARTKTLDDCQIEQARDIRKRSVRIAACAIVVNTGGLLMYIAPLAFTVMGVAALRSQYKNHIKELLSMPGAELQRVAPALSGEALLS